MKTSNFIILSLVVGIVAFVSAFTGYVFGARANQEVPKTVQNTNVVRKSVEQKSGAVAPKVEQPAVTQSYLLKDRSCLFPHLTQDLQRMLIFPYSRVQIQRLRLSTSTNREEELLHPFV